MRTEYRMSESQMADWKAICQAFARKQNAKIVYIDPQACGLEYPNGQLERVTVSDMLVALTEAK